MDTDDIFDSGGELDDLGVGDAPPGTPARPNHEVIRLINELPDRESLAVVDAMRGQMVDDLPNASQEVRDLIEMAKEYGFGVTTKPAVPLEQPAERTPIDWERVPIDQISRLSDSILSGEHLDPTDPYAAIVATAIGDMERREEEMSRG